MLGDVFKRLGEWIYVPEADVPLYNMEPDEPEAPRTGDDRHTATWALLSIGALGGITLLDYVQRKKDREERQ